MDLLIVEGSWSNRACNKLYSRRVLDHYDTHMHTSHTYFNKAIIIKYNTSVSMMMIYVYPNQGFIHDLRFASDSLGRGELCYNYNKLINTLKRAKHAPRVGSGAYSQYFLGNLLLWDWLGIHGIRHLCPKRFSYNNPIHVLLCFIIVLKQLKISLLSGGGNPMAPPSPPSAVWNPAKSACKKYTNTQMD